MPTVEIGIMMGLALMFSLALFFSFLTYKDVETFFIWLTIFCGFVVWGGLLPLWVLVVDLIILTLIIANNVNKKRDV